MTLKEKFETTMVSFLIDKNQDKTMLDHFDKIADEFAIGFDNWKYNNCIYYVGWKVLLGDKYPNTYSVEELLEIYKKEKKL
jgi:hypothetical protein